VLRSAVAAVCAMTTLGLVQAAPAQDSYSDPAGSGAIISALGWLQGTLLDPALPMLRPRLINLIVTAQ
jgi:hypothetical protein